MMKTRPDKAEVNAKVSKLLSRFGHNARGSGDISQRGMSMAEYQTIIQTLPFLKSTHLNFAGSDIRDDGVVMLAEALKSNKVVQSLNLTDTKMTDVGAEALRDMLATNNTVIAIDVSYNIIRSGLLKQLNTLLQSNIKFQQALSAGQHDSIGKMAPK
jgi:hypothetical protein